MVSANGAHHPCGVTGTVRVARVAASGVVTCIARSGDHGPGWVWAVVVTLDDHGTTRRDAEPLSK